MRKFDSRRIAVYGMVAAVYAVLTIVMAPYSFYGVQFRIGEALVLLCFYKKDYIVALTIGCAIANLFSPMLAWDMTVGVFATFLSVLMISFSKNIYIASLFPVVINGVLVGIGVTKYFGGGLLINMGLVALGEFICISIVGIIIFKSLEKNKKFMRLIKFEN
ncbi:MAG: QueT transporter family protein [Oscillospiraceae bacterium]|jgi:uncharacterized membrane protein